MPHRDIKGSNDESCPILESINLLGGRYKLLIIRAMLGAEGKPLRFGEIGREMGGVSQKTLTRNLRKLEQAGLIERKVYAEVPPRVEYSLTKEGEDLYPVFLSLREWRESHR